MPSSNHTIRFKHNWTENPLSTASATANTTFSDEQIYLFKQNQKSFHHYQWIEDTRNILIHARYESAPSIIGCRRHYICNRPLLCARCAKHRGFTLNRSAEHVPIENMYFITVSHANQQQFNTEHINSHFFKSYRKRITRLKRDGLASMFIASQEVSIRSLYPKLTVNPHIHLILQSSNPEAVIQRLSKAGIKTECNNGPTTAGLGC